MASACVNNINVTQEFPAYGCFNPRASFSREDSRSSGSAVPEMIRKQIPTTAEEEEEEEAGDFEFSLVDSSAGGMLPADELFSDGKLVTTTTTTTKQSTTAEIAGKCVETEISKAPRCSSRWRELLGLKRFSQTTNKSTNPNPNPSSRSLKQFLNRSSRSSSSSSSSSLLMNQPLLKDSDPESISISSSRMSLSSSSSSSGHDHEDLPRLSLDNHTANPFAPARSLNPNPPRMRLVNGGASRIGRTQIRCSESSSSVMSRGVSVDSPRLNSSGKIVFQSLERSSSSPSSFNGGYRHNRGTERSYSSNVVRVTPVLNVPVCSIKAGSVIFGQFFSNNRASSSSSASSSSHGGGGIIRGRNSTDRI